MPAREGPMQPRGRGVAIDVEIAKDAKGGWRFAIRVGNAVFGVLALLVAGSLGFNASKLVGIAMRFWR